MDAEQRFEAVLGLDSDFDLCDGAVQIIYEQFGNTLGKATTERCAGVIDLVWFSKGVIDNGGFQYLLEHSVDLLPIHQAYKTIEMSSIARLIDRVISLFSASVNAADQPSRLQDYMSAAQQTREEIDQAFYAETKEIEVRLASYIRNNAGRLRSELYK
jgi:hypothetical protein